jgi:hypothetical protein
VLLKIVYVLTWRTLGLVVVLFRGDRAIAAEVLVLWHQNAVLRRQGGRVNTSWSPLTESNRRPSPYHRDARGP